MMSKREVRDLPEHNVWHMPTFYSILYVTDGITTAANLLKSTAYPQ